MQNSQKCEVPEFMIKLEVQLKSAQLRLSLKYYNRAIRTIK